MSPVAFSIAGRGLANEYQAIFWKQPVHVCLKSVHRLFGSERGFEALGFGHLAGERPEHLRVGANLFVSEPVRFHLGSRRDQ